MMGSSLARKPAIADAVDAVESLREVAKVQL